MQYIKLKDDIVVMVKAIQAVNIHKGGKQTLPDGKEIDVKPTLSVMLPMNAINVQYDSEGDARANYEAILKILGEHP